MEEEVVGFLNSMSFPRNLYQFEKNMENDEHFNVLCILENWLVGWTVDKYAKPGQLCFWMHTANSITHIRNVREELKQNPNHKKYDYLMKCLDKAEDLYNKYGGKIFAIGEVYDEPYEEKNENRDYIHWTSKFYAAIATFYHLEKPIPKESFAHITEIQPKGAITKLNLEQCNKLLALISESENVDISTLKNENKNSGEDWLID